MTEAISVPNLDPETSRILDSRRIFGLINQTETRMMGLPKNDRPTLGQRSR